MAKKLILVYAHGGITKDPGAVNESVKPEFKNWTRP